MASAELPALSTVAWLAMPASVLVMKSERCCFFASRSALAFASLVAMAAWRVRSVVSRFWKPWADFRRLVSFRPAVFFLIASRSLSIWATIWARPLTTVSSRARTSAAPGIFRAWWRPWVPPRA